MREERSSRSVNGDCGELVFYNNSGREICRCGLDSNMESRREATSTLFNANRRGELKWEKYQGYLGLIWENTLYDKEGSILTIFNREDKLSVYRAYSDICWCWKNQKIPAALFVTHIRTLQGFGLELNDDDRRTIREAELLMVEGAIDKLLQEEELGLE